MNRKEFNIVIKEYIEICRKVRDMNQIDLLGLKGCEAIDRIVELEEIIKIEASRNPLFFERFLDKVTRRYMLV